MTKKLLWFLIGFCLIAFPMRYAYSEQCEDMPTTDYNYWMTHMLGNGSKSHAGSFSTEDEAKTACGWDSDPSYSQYQNGDANGKFYAVRKGSTSTSPITWAYHVDNCTPIDTDADDDGIPDNQDMYPNDPTPYSVKLATYYTDDGSPSGNHIFEIWQTDRGHYYHVGEKPSEEDYPKGFLVVNDSTWIDPLDGSTNADGSVTSQNQDSSITGSGVSQPTVTTGPPSGDAEADTDPALEPGTQSSGTETDNEALKGIMDNTGDVATNTKRMGEYMHSLNTAIQNMDRNATIQSSREEQRDNQELEDRAEAEAAKNSLKAFSVEGAIGDQINATITEGEDGDYQDHGDLADETWVQEFIDTNPISAVLDQSGFQYSSASSTANLDLGYLGSHTIDLAPLESGFIAFGNLLVGLVTLTGLIHVVTGRGF